MPKVNDCGELHDGVCWDQQAAGTRTTDTKRKADDCSRTESDLIGIDVDGQQGSLKRLRRSSTTAWDAWDNLSRTPREPRVLSCSRMREMRREPEVPEAEVPAVDCLDGPARITSKELASTRPVKDGTLQNACTTRPRVVVGLGRSAHSHTVRLMNSRQKGLKRMMTKVQWLH